MIPNAPNVPGTAASDTEIKGKMQMAPIKHAAPIAKQTTPRPIFSAEPIVILGPVSGCGHHRAGSMDGRRANVQERNVTSRAEADMAKLFRYPCSRHHPLKYGADMRRRQFIWLLLTALAISLHLVGTPRPGPRIGPRTDPGRVITHSGRSTSYRYKKPDSTKKAQPQSASKDASKGASKDAAKAAAKGPLLIIISIADQRISLYDNGALIARSSVSTGVKNHPTPLGVFSVISKSRFHRSNIYSNAPMPYMQRITWSGIALHAGDLPGYPASHGCIRLTHDFAIRLWHLTKRGTRVIIAHDDIRPAEISNPRLFVPKPKVALASPQSGTAIQRVNDTITADATDAPLISMPRCKRTPKWMPRSCACAGGAAPQKAAPISVFVSRKLSKLFVRQGFVPLFDVPVTI